jgi:hypothetical protein
MPIIVLILGMFLLLANVLYLPTCLMLIDEVNKGKKKNLKAIKFFEKKKLMKKNTLINILMSWKIIFQR